MTLNTLFQGNAAALSRKAGIPTSTLSNLVRNRMSKPSVTNLERLARAIETLDIRWLITGEGSMFISTINSEEATTPQVNTRSNTVELAQKKVVKKRWIVVQK